MDNVCPIRLPLADTKSQSQPPVHGRHYGRGVVVGSTHTTHWRLGRDLATASTLVALTVSGLGAYAWKEQHPPADEDALPLLERIIGGVIGATALPALAAGIFTGVRWLDERCRVLKGDLLRPEKQLERIIGHALAAPLTNEGMLACLHKVQALRNEFPPEELPRELLAGQLARLAAVVPTERDRCVVCIDPLAQLRMVVKAITQLKATGWIDAQAYKDALVKTAGFLAPPQGRPAMQVDAMLEVIMGTQKDKAMQDPLRVRAALMVELGDTPYFSRHHDALRRQGAALLGCTDDAFSAAMPQAAMPADGTQAIAGAAAEAATTPAAIEQRIHEADEEQLDAEVAAALALARAQPAALQTSFVLALSSGLQARSPRADGAFLEGLLAPESAEALIAEVEKSELPDVRNADAARRLKSVQIQQLLQTCQLQADKRLLLGAVASLERLKAHPTEIVGALEAVNNRLTSRGQLHHPWLNDPELRDLRAELATAAHEADFRSEPVSPISIELQD